MEWKSESELQSRRAGPGGKELGRGKLYSTIEILIGLKRLWYDDADEGGDEE